MKSKLTIHKLAGLERTAQTLKCAPQQLKNFLSAGYVPQPKQLHFHAAARLCDLPDGPSQIGFGGARGPGKSHASFAQLALDDCRHIPGLKALYIRRSAKRARELYDAAKIDGSGDFGIYRNIILPLTKPILSALAIFVFLGAFNANLWPLVILNEEKKLTLPLIIARMANRFGGTDYQAVMAGSVLVSIPPLIVFLIFQKNFVRGIALMGLKG